MQGFLNELKAGLGIGRCSPPLLLVAGLCPAIGSAELLSAEPRKVITGQSPVTRGGVNG